MNRPNIILEKKYEAINKLYMDGYSIPNACKKIKMTTSNYYKICTKLGKNSVAAKSKKQDGCGMKVENIEENKLESLQISEPIKTENNEINIINKVDVVPKKKYIIMKNIPINIF